jgi:hypothetical protein
MRWVRWWMRNKWQFGSRAGRSSRRGKSRRRRRHTSRFLKSERIRAVWSYFLHLF